MAWIKTAKGELLNLDKISTIRIGTVHGKFNLIAFEATGAGEDNPIFHENIMNSTEDKTEAEAALAALQKLVRAQTVEELIEQTRADESTRPGFRRS